MSRRWGQTLVSGAQCQDKGQQAQTESQDVPSEEKLPKCEGVRALEQAVREDVVEYLLFWRYWKPAWRWCCVACSEWTCFGGGLDWMISRGSFQPQPFCHSFHDISFSSEWQLNHLKTWEIVLAETRHRELIFTGMNQDDLRKLWYLNNVKFKESGKKHVAQLNTPWQLIRAQKSHTECILFIDGIA